MCLACDTRRELERRLADPGLPASERWKVQEALDQLADRVMDDVDSVEKYVPKEVLSVIAELTQGVMNGVIGLAKVQYKDSGEWVFMLTVQQVTDDTDDPAKVWTKSLPVALIPVDGAKGIRDLVNLPEGALPTPPPSSRDEHNPSNWPEYRVGGG